MNLAEENDLLRAQVRQLKDALGHGLRWPAQWRLSGFETATLGVLVLPLLGLGVHGLEALEAHRLPIGVPDKPALPLRRAGVIRRPRAFARRAHSRRCRPRRNRM